MPAILRTTTTDPAFRALVRDLDADLNARYGEVQALYDAHNHVEAITTAVLALDGERPVGCGCFKPHDSQAVELKRMFVAAEARGQGVGSQLVGALEAWARELGYAVVVLETGDRQFEAIAMYAKLGYARTAPFGPYAELPASVCMRKAL